jgi:3',5'-cyclic AMP phosphodiesterase CpdA
MVGNRRRFLWNGAAVLASGLAVRAAAGIYDSKSSDSVRIAYLTDPHVMPNPESERGFAQALEHAQAQNPDLIFCGGDAIMDALTTPLVEVERQWKAFHNLVRQHCSMPLIHCIGNHDVFGWGTPRRHPSGKDMARDRLGLKERYYAFDRGAWRFIVLDSTHWAPDRPSGYKALLDEEQVVWLRQELSATDKWVGIVSHIPILAPCAFFDGPNEESGDWQVPGEWMHLDARRLKTVFHSFPRVKACLSGHTHLVDMVEYLGVTYLCNGAVCGKFWQGSVQEFPPNYALLEFHSDGTVQRTMVAY